MISKSVLGGVGHQIGDTIEINSAVEWTESSRRCGEVGCTVNGKTGQSDEIHTHTTEYAGPKPHEKVHSLGSSAASSLTLSNCVVQSYVRRRGSVVLSVEGGRPTRRQRSQ
jgi:hypothetical protein